MYRKILYPTFIAFLLVVNVASAQKVEWVSSTDQSRWSKQNDLQLVALPTDEPCDAEVIPTQTQQKITGWGGCFNELGWDALQMVNPQDREAILKAFFDKDEGLNYTLCRMPIGANDYARNWYSLDDTPGDLSLKHFNIDRDKTTLIPYIKAAMRYQPALKIWGSPWSPPAWMKVNDHYACQSAPTNDLDPSRAVKGHINMLIQEPKYLSAYANYLSDYVQAYKKQGINVFAVAVQNEPYACPAYPGCLWTADGLRNFIANYAGPTFKRANNGAQIWFGTINNNNIAVFDSVLMDANARKYIAAVGVQWAAKNAIAEINRKYQGLEKIQTETECGSGTFDWAAAEYTFNLMKHYFDNGVSAYMYWNMVLEDTGKSGWGWVQNAQVIVNKQTQKVTYTPEYFLFKHFSHFVPAGSCKIKADGSFDNLVAFKRPDGKIVVIAANEQAQIQHISIKVGRKYFEVDLPAQSFNSFVIN